MKTTTRIRRAIQRAKAVWSELDYAQRRLFEIRTGVVLDDHHNQPKIARRVEELEALYLRSK